ncbi:flagellar basal body rod protein FlgB [Bacillus sp. S/N-304-OC-R1]|uniref:flagellar basal body rod protein FlgB n=1 Tax=Bacillus sp. S/N-304-OC-R1 TaxID=2758034 RepID=UPI001C8DA744|nr:flagellar basal body rod protein FlgB [Bacillus sp. S/N-304-OC-R1]MBY0120701.1 flagellar basal body rod protein FlgB [Bacillus sp. S/N-304-OC-R1]
MKLFSNTITSLENGLNYSALKQKVISQNIANEATPGYKAKDVSFKQSLEEAVNVIHANRTDMRHFDFQGSQLSNAGVITKKNVSYNHNGNSVDIDKEMTDLAGNQIYYNALIERINGKFSSLQTVIRGGK